MKQWYVAHTQPQKEMLAEQQLIAQGFSIYLPRCKRERRHARKIDTVLAPLFPRYLFVELDIAVDRWRSVNGTRGVSNLLTLDEKPVGVPSSIIERLKLREDSEGLVPLDTLGMFVAGDKIHILEGTFSGYSAIYEKMDDKERVQLILNFLGRETRVQLPRYVVEAL